MPNYNFILAKQIINSCTDLESASLGMHEDWFWTAETVWQDGEYLRELPDNADELYEVYKEKRKAGMSFLSDEVREFDNIFIGGIYSSHWATPVLELKFKDGREETINCYTGLLPDQLHKIENQMNWATGCLSGPVQEQRDSIKPIDISKSN